MILIFWLKKLLRGCRWLLYFHVFPLPWQSTDSRASIHCDIQSAHNLPKSDNIDYISPLKKQARKPQTTKEQGHLGWKPLWMTNEPLPDPLEGGFEHSDVILPTARLVTSVNWHHPTKSKKYMEILQISTEWTRLRHLAGSEMACFKGTFPASEWIPPGKSAEFSMDVKNPWVLQCPSTAHVRLSCRFAFHPETQADRAFPPE